jgi:hypothetical protein
MMDKERKKGTEELSSGYSEGCTCQKQRIEHLCKARDVGLERFVECLEEDPYECPYSMLLASMHYCKYPLRISIAKQLKN